MKKSKATFFDVMNVTILIIIAVACVYPFWNILMVSISSATSVLAAKVYLLPHGVNVDSYRYIFTTPRLNIAGSVYNSLLYTSTGGVFAVVLTYFTAYALSRKRLVGRRVVMLLFIFTYMFVAGLIPNYLILSKLGFVNSRLVMIIPNAINTFLLIIARSFLDSIPIEMEESAFIDGANDFQIMLRIFMPISIPVIATISVFYAIQIWNDFIDPLIYLSKDALQPIQLVLYNLVLHPGANSPVLETIMTDQMSVVPKNLEGAAIVLGMVPIMLIYPFAQRYFTKGILLGAVKG
ncbi:MAG TPA: carbohydrate ABC transporter permease [Spirochaetia bacterium]|nr:carbohydrate ABC transporter permease [Spirochaetia bacterium]